MRFRPYSHRLWVFRLVYQWNYEMWPEWCSWRKSFLNVKSRSQTGSPDSITLSWRETLHLFFSSDPPGMFTRLSQKSPLHVWGRPRIFVLHAPFLSEKTQKETKRTTKDPDMVRKKPQETVTAVLLQIEPPRPSASVVPVEQGPSGGFWNNTVHKVHWYVYYLHIYTHTQRNAHCAWCSQREHLVCDGRINCRVMVPRSTVNFPKLSE